SRTSGTTATARRRAASPQGGEHPPKGGGKKKRASAAMTESKHDTEPAGTTERVLEALRHVATDLASDLGGSEAISELGDRARGIVADLAASAKRRIDTARTAQSADPSHKNRDSPGFQSSEPSERSGDPYGENLPRRIHELRACVSEVADVLEATVERLETIEGQLGDPDQSVEQTLKDSLERCERVLMGIEHRVLVGMEHRVLVGMEHRVLVGMEHRVLVGEEHRVLAGMEHRVDAKAQMETASGDDAATRP